MNKITIMDKKGNVIKEIKSAFVPSVGETIWLDRSMKNPDFRNVTGRVIDVVNGTFEIHLFVD